MKARSSNNNPSGRGKRRSFALSLVIVAGVVGLVTSSFAAQTSAVTEEEIELKKFV